LQPDPRHHYKFVCPDGFEANKGRVGRRGPFVKLPTSWHRRYMPSAHNLRIRCPWCAESDSGRILRLKDYRRAPGLRVRSLSPPAPWPPHPRSP
jgi:hypothetical protein